MNTQSENINFFMIFFHYVMYQILAMSQCDLDPYVDSHVNTVFRIIWFVEIL